jgi:peptide/nickel transport system permease protein
VWDFFWRRLTGLIVVMALVATLVFFLTRLAPGDPAALLLGDQASAADISALRAVYGLDQPVLVQFGLWLKEILKGNLGQSIFLQRPVTQALMERAEPTFFLALFSVLIAALIGIPAGIVSAVWRGRLVDQIVSALAMLSANIPSFWLGLLFIQFFAVKWHLFPVAGYGDPGAPLLERLRHLVLPATVLGLVNSALITRFTRASMLDILSEDFIRTARSKGLAENSVVYRHALRVAILPVISYLGPLAANLLTGSIVVETIFHIPGAGGFFVNSILNRDGFLLGGVVIAYCLLLMIFNLMVDLSYRVLDPRIKGS